jgi:hypothetical protein
MTDFSDDTLGEYDDGDTGAGGSDAFFEGLGEAWNNSVESVELGDDGSIDMQIRQPEPEPAAPGSEDSPSSADTSGQPGGGQPSADAAFLEGQYKEVQGWATRVSQENAALKARLDALESGMDHGSTSDASDDGGERSLDPETQAQFDAYMDRNLGAVLSQKLGVPIEEVGPLLNRVAINREMDAARERYDDFDDKMPLMIEVSRKYPNLDFDQLYDLASTFYRPEVDGTSESEDVAAQETVVPPTTTPAAPQPTSPPRETPEQRAQRLQTLESKSNDEGFEPEARITSIQDAAEKALREMNG